MGANISDHIRYVRQISPPPQEFGRLLEMINDDHSDLTDLVHLLEQCPRITARLLQCANSAYFRQAGEIDTVRDAVIRVLGLSLTRNLTLAFLLSDSFNLKSVPHFNNQRYWFSALVTATLAREMAPRLKEPLPNTAALYTAGLLHNIGVAALAHCFPQQMNLALASDTQNLSTKTRQLFQLDHYQAGALLIRSWNIPKSVVEPILYLRNPNYTGTASRQAAVIRVCSELATLLYHKEFARLRQYETSPDLISKIYLEETLYNVESQGRSLDDISHMMSR